MRRMTGPAASTTTTPVTVAGIYHRPEDDGDQWNGAEQSLGVEVEFSWCISESVSRVSLILVHKLSASSEAGWLAGLSALGWQVDGV